MRLLLALVALFVGPETQTAEIVAQAVCECLEEGHGGRCAFRGDVMGKSLATEGRSNQGKKLSRNDAAMACERRLIITVCLLRTARAVLPPSLAPSFGCRPANKPEQKAGAGGAAEVPSPHLTTPCAARRDPSLGPEQTRACHVESVGQGRIPRGLASHLRTSSPVARFGVMQAKQRCSEQWTKDARQSREGRVF